ncbi:MAG: CRISPR-associated protein Cas4 [Clostridiales bacterium]|nr:CRISPR-associated protein Cas4 [Clostridiales bacterium]
MYDEDELLPLSAISQYGYCPRRAGLVLLEQGWADNIHTAEGTAQHERVHEGGRESRANMAELFGVAVRSLTLGLSGKADSLELSADPSGCPIRGMDGLWLVRPVEYKHGKVRHEHEYEMQLCAQAMCLEEMLGCSIPEGDLFYYNDHRRFAVSFTAALRADVRMAAEALHQLVRSGVMPQSLKSRKCRECSLVDICMPGLRDRSTVYRERLRLIASGKEDPL